MSQIAIWIAAASATAGVIAELFGHHESAMDACLMCMFFYLAYGLLKVVGK